MSYVFDTLIWFWHQNSNTGKPKSWHCDMLFNKKQPPKRKSEKSTLDFTTTWQRILKNLTNVHGTTKQAGLSLGIQKEALAQEIGSQAKARGLDFNSYLVPAVRIIYQSLTIRPNLQWQQLPLYQASGTNETHLWDFSTKMLARWWQCLTLNGPFSFSKPSSELQPGPPFNHSTRGSWLGLPADSINLHSTICHIWKITL